MTSAPDAPSVPYVVMTAWHCTACDVQGRTMPGTKVACWNCDGQVVVTARPSVNIDECTPDPTFVTMDGPW